MRDDPTAGRGTELVAGMQDDVARLPEALFQEMLDVFADIPDPVAASMLLRKVAASAGSRRRRGRALDAAVSALRAFEHAHLESRLESLIALASDLEVERQGQLLIDGLRAAREQDQPSVRQRLLSAIGALDRPAGELVAAALEHALAGGMPPSWLQHMAARLPARLVPRVLAAALQTDAPDGGEVLQALLATRSQPPWQAVFSLLLLVPAEPIRARALLRLAEHADHHLVARIVEALSQAESPRLRAEALGRVVPFAGPDAAAGALSAAWTALHGSADEPAIVTLLIDRTIGPPVHGDVWPAAVATVLTMLDKDLRARTLERLAPHLPAPLLEQALKGLQILRDDAERAAALTALLALLRSEAGREAVASIAARVARGIPSPDRRGTQLATLALHAAPADAEPLLREALTAIGRAPDHARTAALTAVGAALARGSDLVMAEALSLTQRLPWQRCEWGACSGPQPAVLARLLPNLAAPLLEKAFAMGGAMVATPVERIRLLDYLAGDGPGLTRMPTSILRGRLAQAGAHVPDRATDLAVGWDPEHVERLALLLRDGPLALHDRYLSDAGAAPFFWPLRDRDDVGNELLDGIMQLGVIDGPPLMARVGADLSPGLMSRALTAVAVIDDESRRAAALRHVAPFLEPEFLPSAVRIVHTLSDRVAREEVLIRLLPLLPVPLPAGVLTRVRALPDAAARAWLLRTIAVRTAGPRQEALVVESIEAARGIERTSERVRFLIDLAARIAPPLRRLVVAAVSIAGAGAEADALIGIMPLLSAGDAAALGAAIARIEDEADRVAVLYAVGRFACAELLGDGLRLVEGIENPFRRSLAIGAFAPRVPPELLPDVLRAATGISNLIARAEAVAVLARHARERLPGDIVDAALSDLHAVHDDGFRSQLAAQLLPHVPPAYVPDACALVQVIGDENARAHAIGALLESVAEEWVTEVKGLVDGIEDLRLRAMLLTLVAARVSPVERAITIDQAVDVAQRMPSRQERADALLDIADTVDPRDAAEIASCALRRAQAVNRQDYFVHAVERLAPRFDARLVREVLQHATTLDEASRVRIVAALASKMASSAQEQALMASRAWRGQVSRRDLLCALAPHLGDEVWPLAVTAAIDGLAEGYRADVLIELAGSAPAGALPGVLAAAQRIQAREPLLKVTWGLEQVLRHRVEPIPAPSAPAAPAAIVADVDVAEAFAPVLRAAHSPRAARRREPGARPSYTRAIRSACSVYSYAFLRRVTRGDMTV